MSDVPSKRVLLAGVEAPCPPNPLSAQEVIVLQRMIRSGIKRNRRRADANEAEQRELPGADANAARAHQLEGIALKFEAWLEAMRPQIDAAMRSAPAEDDEADADREAWLAESRAQGERLAAGQ